MYRLSNYEIKQHIKSHQLWTKHHYMVLSVMEKVPKYIQKTKMSLRKLNKKGPNSLNMQVASPQEYPRDCEFVIIKFIKCSN